MASTQLRTNSLPNEASSCDCTHEQRDMDIDLAVERERVENIMLSTNFRILCHHIYEYRKGLRSLVLHTMITNEKEATEALLQRQHIDYIIQPVSPCRFNVYFGDTKFVKIIEMLHITQLSSLSDEQDFILGIMLGYSRATQYERYLQRKNSLQ